MARSIIRANSCLLWTNPMAGQPYGEGTVWLDLSGFRAVQIVFMPFHSFGELGMTELRVGMTGVLFYMFFNKDTASSAAASLNGVTRMCTVASDRVVFGNGQMVYNGYAYTDWSNRAVPYQIFGIR